MIDEFQSRFLGVNPQVKKPRKWKGCNATTWTSASRHKYVGGYYQKTFSFLITLSVIS